VENAHILLLATTKGDIVNIGSRQISFLVFGLSLGFYLACFDAGWYWYLAMGFCLGYLYA